MVKISYDSDDEAKTVGKTAATRWVKGDIRNYRNFVEDFLNSNMDNRTELQLDVKYYHGEQLTRDERSKLDDRKQPAIVINRLRVAVNGIVGVAQRAKTDPKAYPRTPGDENSADVASATLKYAMDVTKFTRAKGRCFRDMVMTGTAAAMCILDGDLRPVIRRIRWNELIYDPRSLEEDFSDATYMGFGKWMYTSTLQEMYPEADIEATSSATRGLSELTDSASEDKPFASTWVDEKFNRVYVVEIYYIDKGKWMRCVFYAGGVLEEGESPWPDDKGRPGNPIVAQTLYITDDNARYGAVRDMRDLQDEINKRRSKMLHLINVSQIQAEDPNAVEVNADEARKEAAQPDGVLPMGWRKVPTTDMTQGQAQLLTESKAELERMGPNPAMLGRQGADSSGKALQTRQDAGMVELSILYDGLEEWEVNVYRRMWCNIKKWWTAPQYIRVTDDVEDTKFIGINQPKMGQVPGVDPETGDPMMGHNGGPSMMEDVIGYDNDIAEMDVDFTIDSTPHYANLMAEQLLVISDAVGRNPNYADQVPFEILLEMTSFPGKRELIKKVRAFRAQAEAAKQGQVKHDNDMVVMEKVAEIQETNSQTTLNLAQAHKAGADTTLQMQGVINEAAKMEQDRVLEEQAQAQQAQQAAAEQQSGASAA